VSIFKIDLPASSYYLSGQLTLQSSRGQQYNTSVASYISVKGIVHPNDDAVIIYSLLCCVPTLYEFLSSVEHKISCLEECQ